MLLAAATYILTVPSGIANSRDIHVSIIRDPPADSIAMQKKRSSDLGLPSAVGKWGSGQKQDSRRQSRFKLICTNADL